MDYKILNKKIQLTTFFLAIPFYISLQASEEDVGNDLQPSRRHNPILPSDQASQTLIGQTKRTTLTPKEKQISKLIGRQFFQLRNNDIASRSPSIGLYALVAIEQKSSNDEKNGQPITLEYDELKQTIAQIFPNNPKPLSVKIDPHFVQQIAEKTNMSILFIHIGNRGCSYGPGPIDIVKRIIFVKRDGKVLTQNSWFFDDHLINDIINIISQCGSNTAVVCYNSHLGRTVFSTPNGQIFAISQKANAQTRSHQTAIVNISKKRTIRNIGLSASLLAVIYVLKKIVLPTITQYQNSMNFTEIVQPLKQKASQLFDQISMNFTKTVQLVKQKASHLFDQIIPSSDSSCSQACESSSMPNSTATPSPSPSPVLGSSSMPNSTATPSPSPSPVLGSSSIPNSTATPSPSPSPVLGSSPIPNPTTTPSPSPSPVLGSSPIPTTTTPSPSPDPAQKSSLMLTIQQQLHRFFPALHVNPF
ncbi:MAG: hypothetical protein LBH08_01930 [Puniceicoccales bacterium]|jgi:hypothetical protein|nr:hypothetical protein [Puniceicoccales bacterium]